MDTTTRNYLYDKLFNNKDFYDASADGIAIFLSALRKYYDEFDEKLTLASLLQIARRTLNSYVREKNTKDMNEALNHYLVVKQLAQTNNKDVLESEWNAAIDELVPLDTADYSAQEFEKLYRLHFKLYYDREQFRLSKDALPECLQDVAVLYRLLRDYPDYGQNIELVVPKMEKLHSHVVHILEQLRPDRPAPDSDCLPADYRARIEFCSRYLEEHCTAFLYSSCIFDSNGVRIQRVDIDPRLEFVRSDKRGNHIKSRADIEENTLVLSEIPDSSSVGNNYLKSKCINCLKNLSTAVVPCEHCKEVTFCSLFCRDEAYQHFHRYECGVLGYLNRISLAASQTFRILSRVGLERAVQAEQDTGFQVTRFFQRPDIGRKNSADFTAEDELFLYQMSASLATHAFSRKFKKHDNIVYFLDCLNLTLALIVIHNQNLECEGGVEDYFYFDTEDGQKWFFSLFSLCYKFVRRVAVNVFGEFDYRNTSKETMATLKLLLGSYFNHSCDPNLYWEVADGKITFKTKRAIKPGEELTITYGATKSTGGFMERQLRLDHFQFVCTCEMCSQDIPFQENVVRCRDCRMEGVFVLKNTPVCAGCQKTFDYETVNEAGITLKCNEEYINILIQSSENNPRLWDTKRFKKTLTPMLKQIRETAFETSWHFLKTLSNIAKIYLMAGQPRMAMECCQRYNQIYEQLVAKLNLELVTGDFEKKDFFEERLREIDFWSDLAFKNASQKCRADYELASTLYSRLFTVVDGFLKDYLVEADPRNEIFKNFLEQVNSRKLAEYQAIQTWF